MLRPLVAIVLLLGAVLQIPTTAERADASPVMPGTYNAIAAKRVVDSRGGGPRVEPQGIRTFGVEDVPALNGIHVAALAVTITAVDAAGPGYLTAWPSGSPQPGASLLNYQPGVVARANFAIVAVGPDNLVNVGVNQSAAHVLVDVVGYATGGNPAVTGSIVALPPSRIFDSRTGEGYDAATGLPAGSPIPAGRSVTTPGNGRGGVPIVGANGVLLNVTVSQWTGAGWVTVSAATNAVPGISNVNYGNQTAEANLVVAALGADGRIRMSVGGSGATHVTVDVIGFISGAIGQQNQSLRLMAPHRAFDTRSGLGARLTKHDLYYYDAPTIGKVPEGAESVIANLTTVNSSGPGYLSAAGRNPWNTSTLNYQNARPVAALAFIEIVDSRMFGVLNSYGASTDLVIDVVGYIWPT